MSYEQLISSLKFVLLNEDLKRVNIRLIENGHAYIDLDLHGMNRKQAKRTVKNIISVIRGEFILNVIHGYNNGMVLKKMLMESRLSTRVVDRKCPVWNPGQTYLTIAA